MSHGKNGWGWGNVPPPATIAARDMENYAGRGFAAYGVGLWITYDDPQSMKAKTDFIKERGLGGAMFWELSNDRTYQLLDTLVANL